MLSRCANCVPAYADIDYAFKELTAVLHISAKNLPRSKFRKHLRPYWCEEMSTLKRDKVIAYRQWVSVGRSRNRDNLYRIKYLKTKKAFNKRLHCLAREYENESLKHIMMSAEINSTEFWRILKRNRDVCGPKVYAVANRGGTIVHNLDEVLEVWRQHFSELCTPKDDPTFDNDHFSNVNKMVGDWRLLRDTDEFLGEPFILSEVNEAITKLNVGKAPGMDNITAEHLKYGGSMVPQVLLFLYNWILQLEYIPVNFREGIQVPLHKGKNTPITDPDNFRGITLLNTFSKLFEILIWKRMESWWMSRITPLQGARRKGVSCLHTAMMLQT